MHSRYTSESMARLWSDDHKYAIWADLEIRVLEAQATAGVIPPAWVEQAEATPAPTPPQVAESELTHRHEVVAFLTAWGVPHVHIGITSSDIIDLEQGLRVAAATEHLGRQLDFLHAALLARARAGVGIKSVARTHGQAAAECSAAHLDVEHLSQLSRAWACLQEAGGHLREHAKLRGPTGNYSPPALTPQIEQEVLDSLGLIPTPSATQLAPRDLMVRWGAACAEVARACHRIALQTRLDAQTGVGAVVLAPAGVGSSSMPHKNNPVEAEQVCGLATVVYHLAHSLEPTALIWGHRDLSNSSIERIVLPQLSSYLEQILSATTETVRRAQPRSVGAAPHSGIDQMMAQLQGVPYLEARTQHPHPNTPRPEPVDWISPALDQMISE